MNNTKAPIAKINSDVNLYLLKIALHQPQLSK